MHPSATQHPQLSPRWLAPLPRNTGTNLLDLTIDELEDVVVDEVRPVLLL